jgi:hypothetical protein
MHVHGFERMIRVEASLDLKRIFPELYRADPMLVASARQTN